MELFFDKVKEHFENSLPFAIYRKPNDTFISGFFQKNDNLYLINDFSEKGFAFCSFTNEKKVFIPENQSEICTTTTNFLLENKEIKIKSLPAINAETNFEKLVEKGVSAIKNKQFKKIVLSRKELLEISDFDLVTIFKRIIHNYPNAFSYCFFHPKVGLWIGGFSEQLIKMDGINFSTMAVAGTQPFVENLPVIWQNKDINEQQFVTDFILENLKEYTSNITISAPHTLKAGNVVHIKTAIQGTIKETSTLTKIIEVLHPTPAVCGLPKSEAKAFIIANEGYDREFYSGFLGELNIASTTDLFVNLRCMQIKDNLAQLYVGCGITKDSIPEKEWIETVNKSMTMKKNFDIN